jgi:hypothetical protein
MSRNGGGPREIAMPVSVFDSLRTELAKAAGTLETVRALHHAGYQAGLASAGNVNQEAGGNAFNLSESGFWSNLTDYFSKRGWGTLSHGAPHPGVGLLSSTDWAEASPENVTSDASCSFSAGFLSGLLSQLAGGPIAVLEVRCRTRGDHSCGFAFGSETAIHDLYGHLLEGDDLNAALEAL